MDEAVAPSGRSCWRGTSPFIISVFVALVKRFHFEHPSVFFPPALSLSPALFIFCHIFPQDVIHNILKGKHEILDK